MISISKTEKVDIFFLESVEKLMVFSFPSLFIQTLSSHKCWSATSLMMSRDRKTSSSLHSVFCLSFLFSSWFWERKQHKQIPVVSPFLLLLSVCFHLYISLYLFLSLRLNGCDRHQHPPLLLLTMKSFPSCVPSLFLYYSSFFLDLSEDKISKRRQFRLFFCRSLLLLTD